jgi:hypothetical protein
MAAAAFLVCVALPAGAQDAGQVLALVNEQRAIAGLAPLARVAELDAAALRHSKDMAEGDFMSHTGSDGSNPGQRITASGYRWTSYGENVAVGFPSAESVVAAWMQSPGHRANILGAGFRHLGAAVVSRSDRRFGTYWTLNLASGTPQSSTPPAGSPLPGPVLPPPPPALPSIALLSPARGPVGTTATLQGARFGTAPGVVRFNGIEAAIRSWSDTRIQAVVPTGATTGRLSITTAAGTASGPTFQVTAPPTPTTTAPRLLSLSLAQSPSGLTMALTGDGFGVTQGLGRVLLRRTTSPLTSTPAVLEWSATRLVVRPSPLSPGSYDVSVRRADGRTSNTLRLTIR